MMVFADAGAMIPKIAAAEIAAAIIDSLGLRHECVLSSSSRFVSGKGSLIASGERFASRERRTLLTLVESVKQPRNFGAQREHIR